MSLNPRNFTMGAVWAKDAATTIPAPPVKGAAYRNTTISTSNIEQGQSYDQLWDSARNNEVSYRVTGLVKQFEEYGFAVHSPLTNYLANISITFGQDGNIYIATRNSGPQYGGSQDPVYTTGYWEKFSSYIKTGSVPETRKVNTTAPLTGGGDLSTDRTLGVSSATTTAAGVVSLATSGEVITGTDNTKAVTSSGLSARTATTSRTGIVALATAAEVAAGTNNAKAVTPAGLAPVLGSKIGIVPVPITGAGTVSITAPFTANTITVAGYAKTNVVGVETTQNVTMQIGTVGSVARRRAGSRSGSSGWQYNSEYYIGLNSTISGAVTSGQTIPVTLSITGGSIADANVTLFFHNN